MGKVKHFRIALHSENDVFYPGDVVSGKCVIELWSKLKVKAINVHMKGSAKVHWTEKDTITTNLSIFSKFVNSEIEYFFEKKTLFNSEDNGSSDTLAKGVHEFEFRFEIPNRGLSTSFEGKYGNVRYWIKGEIERPWSFNYRTKRAFTLICPININYSKYLIPVEKEVEKTFCRFLCIPNSIEIHAKTDRTGYCPGESISISAEFVNQTRCTVVPHATLHQTQLFISGEKFRSRNMKFTIVTGLAIQAHKTAIWDGQLLKIPPVSPSILNCHLIRVEYFVRVSLHIPLIGYKCYIDLPIIIGTVPCRMVSLLSTLREPPLVDTNHTTFHRSLPTTLSDDTFQPTNMTPPPTYFECISGSVDIREDEDGEMIGDTRFTPRYTYVNNSFYDPPPEYSEVVNQCKSI